MAAAADGELDVVVAAEAYAGDDVGGVLAAGDRGRILVDHAVVDGARLVIAGVARNDQVASQAAASGLSASVVVSVVMWAPFQLTAPRDGTPRS